MAKKNQSNIFILTISGKDKVGIIAKLSGAMTKANVNIIDVTQKVVEGTFVMTMACDMIAASASVEAIQKKLARIAKEMDLNITFQNETIFKAMHRI